MPSTVYVSSAPSPAADDSAHQSTLATADAAYARVYAACRHVLTLVIARVHQARDAVADQRPEIRHQRTRDGAGRDKLRAGEAAGEEGGDTRPTLRRPRAASGAAALQRRGSGWPRDGGRVFPLHGQLFCAGLEFLDALLVMTSHLGWHEAPPGSASRPAKATLLASARASSSLLRPAISAWRLTVCR